MKPSGFGAGIHDDEFGFVDDSPEIIDSKELVDDQIDVDSEPETRPRRRRGRGRRSEPRSSENSDAGIDPRDSDEDRDSEDDDSNELIGRNSKIPSWQDAIGTLVTANMENHQRNQSQNRSPRGRGPRRDR